MKFKYVGKFSPISFTVFNYKGKSKKFENLKTGDIIEVTDKVMIKNIKNSKDHQGNKIFETV